MLGKVLKVRYKITQADAEYTWMGQMEAGDWVVLVQKLEPTAGGLASSFFMLKDKVFPCWVEDLRVIKIKLKESTKKLRKDRIPALWRYFCRQHWLDNCRPGEKMRDKLKNPKDRSDKEVYTIHFREKLIKDLYTDCLVKGKEKWHLEWNFFCSCHGKDISDPECGTCKICARQREMEHTELKPTRIRTALELKDFCEGKLTWPQKKLTQKQGKGIFKRQFFYVPASGVGAANRRIRKGKTLKGSSRLHVIADIGIAGKLKIRERGCHQPGCPCWTGMYEQCAHIPREGSLGLAEASHPLLSHTVSIEKDVNAEHIIPMTRNFLCK